MITTAIVFLGISIAFVLLQSVLIFQYTTVLKKKSSRVAADHASPVAIILCVRGFDPSLKSCLQSLTQQDYSQKTLFVVGDNANDPGLLAAREFLDANHNGVDFRILVNDQVHQTCSLKCSNLIFACAQLEQQIEFVALVDADSSPPRDWLRMMIAPFSHDDVAVSTGVRWFISNGSYLGTLVRYIWNTAAIVQMVCYQIPWGGSLMIRASFIRDADVLEQWSKGFCEDTMLDSICRRQNKQISVVADAVIPSAEQTELSACIPWISRQLLTTKLHHPKWPLVLGHGLLTGTLSFGSLILMLYGAASHTLAAAILFACTYLLIQVSNVLLLNWIEIPIAKKDRQNSTRIGLMRFMVGILTTQVCYCLAVIKTVFARAVRWRQIEYRIKKSSIELVEYRGFNQSETGGNPSRSL